MKRFYNLSQVVRRFCCFGLTFFIISMSQAAWSNMPLTSISYVKQVGSGESSLCKKPGNGVMLDEALGKILPHGWEYGFFSKYKDQMKDLKVYWSSDDPWMDVLTRVANGYGVFVTVNWSEQFISFKPSPDAKKHLEKRKVKNKKTTVKKDSGVKNDTIKNYSRVKVAKKLESTVKHETAEYVQGFGQYENAKNKKAEKEKSRTGMPRKLASGFFTESLSAWAKSWGYECVFKGMNHIERLSLNYPLVLTGTSFKKDLQTIAKDINQDNRHIYKFKVHRKNGILSVNVSRK